MKRALKWVAAALLVLAGVVGLIVWDAHRRANDVLQAGARENESLIAAFRGRLFARPILEGPPLEGNAWDLYAVHVKALGELPAEEVAEIPDVDELWESGRRPDDEVLDFLYHKYEPHLWGLREALRRPIVDPGFAYDEGLNVDMPLISPSLQAAKILGEGMAHFHRMGNGTKALDLALTGLGFAHDQRPAVVGLLVGLVIEGVVVHNLVLLLEDHRFKAIDLRRFAELLEALDAAAPRVLADAWDEEELFIRSTLTAEAEAPGIAPNLKLFEDPAPGWRQLWSKRIGRAQALTALPAAMEEVRRTFSLPAHARVLEVERFQEEWPRHLPPLLRVTFRSLLRAFIGHAESLSVRALLRVGVALALYELDRGEFPRALDDLVPKYLKEVPLCALTGTPLGYEAGKVWSRGSDKMDNGGACDPEEPLRFDKAGMDVVVTVKRRK